NVYVGLAFSPQNDDIPPGADLRKSFVAKFREYQIVPKNAGHLRIQPVENHAEVTWDSGWTLETATTVSGPWTNAASQQNPLRVDFTESMRFYRVRRSP